MGLHSYLYSEVYWLSSVDTSTRLSTGTGADSLVFTLVLITMGIVLVLITLGIVLVLITMALYSYSQQWELYSYS